MVKVKISTTSNGEIVSFEVKGHANYAKHGQDIVCAGVSAVVQTAVLGLEHFLDGTPAVTIREGYLKCSLPAALTLEERARAAVVLKTMALGIEMTARSYPKNLQLVWQIVAD